MKNVILILCGLMILVSCRKIFPIKNKNKISVVNTSNYNCSAKIRLDGGTEQIIEKGGAFTFENVTDGDHTVSLLAGSPCINYSSGSTCTFSTSKSVTKTVSVTNTSGAQLTLNCN
jgi:hypothetical protein